MIKDSTTVRERRWRITQGEVLWGNRPAPWVLGWLALGFWMTLSRTLQYIARMRVCLSVKLGMKRGSVWIFEDGGQDKSSGPSKLDLRAKNLGEEYR